MKRLIALIHITLVFSAVFSQNLDSLFQVYQRLNEQGKKREAVDILRQLVYYWIDINPLTASQYAAMANQEATALGDSTLIAQTYNDIGNCYLAQKTYFMATEAFFKAYDIFMVLNDTPNIGYTLINIGKSYLQQGIADIAESKFDQALKIFTRLNDPQGQAQAYQYLGLANLTSDEQLAIQYFKKSLKILRDLNLEEKVAQTTYHLARAFYQIGEYDSSVVYAKIALETFREKNNRIWEGKTYILLAQNYIELELYDQATRYLEQALQIFEHYQNHENIALINLLKAQIRYQTGDYKKAIELAQKAVSTAQMFNYIEILSKAYNLLANCYADLNDYRQAFHYQSLYANSLIQLYEQKKQQHFSSFQMNLETQNKERQIEMLKIQAEKERLMRDKEMYRRNFFYILVIIGLIALFVFFLILRFREKVRTTRLLESTNAQLIEEIEIRKKTELELKNSEERYRLLFRKTPVGIMQYDENLLIIDANDRFAEIFHVPRKQIINAPLDKIFDRNLIKIFKQALEKEEEIYSEQVEILTTQGIVYVTLTIKPYVFTKDDKVVKSAIVIVQDITEHKKTEQLYKSSIVRKQKLVDLMPDSLILVNSKGEILEAHLPHSPEKEVGVKNLTELLPQHTIRLFLNELDLAIKRKKMRRFFFTSSKGVQLWARIIPDQTNNALIIISQIPVTQEEKSETALHQVSQNRLQAREKFHRDLENVIENELIPIYQNLQRALSFLILKNFIERMQQTAERFKLTELKTYAQKLEQALHEFDVQEVNRLLAQFPAIISKYIGYETITF